MSLEFYIDKLNSINIKEFSYDLRTVSLFEPSEIEERQLGYSIDTEGNDLTGAGIGPWKKYWVVIGSEDMLGDPIFLDSRDGCVLTAAHGIGKWKPKSISKTIEGFFKALNIIKSLGRDNSKKSRLQAISKIIGTTEAQDVGFWKDWLDLN